jgi:hypothetical protein
VRVNRRTIRIGIVLVTLSLSLIRFACTHDVSRIPSRIAGATQSLRWRFADRENAFEKTKKDAQPAKIDEF